MVGQSATAPKNSDTFIFCQLSLCPALTIWWKFSKSQLSMTLAIRLEDSADFREFLAGKDSRVFTADAKGVIRAWCPPCPPLPCPPSTPALARTLSLDLGVLTTDAQGVILSSSVLCIEKTIG